MYVNARHAHWHHEDRTRAFFISRGGFWVASQRAPRAIQSRTRRVLAINLTSNSVLFCQSRHRALRRHAVFSESAVVVGNSVDTEISHFQLNLAESNFTGPMCISGLMHSIPGGPSDELYLHGIILALPPAFLSPLPPPPPLAPRDLSSRSAPSILSLIIRVAPLSVLLHRW